MNFLSLPIIVMENIFTHLTFDEIAKYRIVSKGFNEICMCMLNRGFLMIERRHALALKSVKAQLPRRESERRYHPLARHCDILTSIETRISMLNMTYSKFIDNGICCFIPGKVIDEISRILTLVESSKTPPRAHEVLQELRDISSMAIEHFDDKISRAFRKKLQRVIHISHTSSPPKPSQATLLPIALRQDICNIRRRTLLNAKLSIQLAAQNKTFYKAMIQYRQVACKQRRRIMYLCKRQQDQEATMADLKKRIEECDIKYSKLTHTDQSVGGSVIAGSSASEMTSNVTPLRHFGSQIKLDLSVLPIGTNKRNSTKLLSNIKPRKPQIRLPSLSEDIESTTPNPVPSTSNQSLRQKSQNTMAKIRGITNEIRELSNLSKTLDLKLKRPLISNTEESDIKKQKMH